MIEDDRFDELLARAAEDYNRPPDGIPRDEMWSAIEAKRARAPHLRIVRGGTHRPTFPRYVWMSAAAAAVLLIALGVGIGRWTAKPVASSGMRVAGNDTGARPAQPTAGNPQPATVGTQPGSRNPQPELRVASDTGNTPPRPRPGTLERKPSSRRPTAPGGSLDQFGPSAYQVATAQHLADAEALLTSFRIESRNQKMDASLSIWARDLLTSTRLLLDSPAAEDPRRVRLLQDLELVLAQIVQLSPDAASRERELIEGAIRDQNVMTRLRTAVPAGPTRGL